MSLDAYISDLNTNHVALSHEMTLPDNETIVWDGPDSISEHDDNEDHETVDDEEDEDEDDWDEDESEITLSESLAADLVE